MSIGISNTRIIVDNSMMGMDVKLEEAEEGMGDIKWLQENQNIHRSLAVQGGQENRGLGVEASAVK